MPSYPGVSSYRLAISEEAKSDIDEIRGTDRETADYLLAVLEWIGDRGDELEHLNDHNYGANPNALPMPHFNVCKWLETWKGNSPAYLWRVKLWELEQHGIQYRVIYAYQVGSRTFWILGIVHRDFAYDPNHPKNRRILQQADAL